MRIEDERDNLIRRATELRIMLARARADSAAFRTRAMELLATAAESRESVASTREVFRRDPASAAHAHASLQAVDHLQASGSAARASGPSPDSHEVAGPAQGGYQHGDYLVRLMRQMQELRRYGADLAGAIARTEEEIAATFEAMARNRPPADASRLRAQADKARQFAAKERARAAEAGQAETARRSAVTRRPRQPPRGG